MFEDIAGCHSFAGPASVPANPFGGDESDLDLGEDFDQLDPEDLNRQEEQLQSQVAVLMGLLTSAGPNVVPFQLHRSRCQTLHWEMMLAAFKVIGFDFRCECEPSSNCESFTSKSKCFSDCKTL